MIPGVAKIKNELNFLEYLDGQQLNQQIITSLGQLTPRTQSAKKRHLSNTSIFIAHTGIFIVMEINGNGQNGDKELVYLFLYNPMVYTSGWTTQSVHKTRKAAIQAMEEHKLLSMNKWQEDFQTPEEQQHHPFGKFEDWRVTAMVLQH